MYNRYCIKIATKIIDTIKIYTICNGWCIANNNV